MNTSNPIVGTYEETTSNYLSSFAAILSKVKKGEVVIATHSAETIKEVLSMSQN